MSDNLWARYCRAISRHYDRKAIAAMPARSGCWKRYRKAMDTSDFWWWLGGGKGR